jgi:hypothetical protein
MEVVRGAARRRFAMPAGMYACTAVLLISLAGERKRAQRREAGKEAGWERRRRR